MIFLTWIRSQYFAAAALLVIFYGVLEVLCCTRAGETAFPLFGWMGTLGGIAAAAVVAPIAVLVPWTLPGGEAMAAFMLGAALLWLAMLSAERRGVERRTSVLVAASAAAAFLSPQALWLVAAAALYFAGRRAPGGGRAAALMAVAALAMVVFFFAPFEVHKWTPRGVAGTFGGALSNAWSASDWYGATLGRNFLRMQTAYNNWFYWPMALPIAALLYQVRRDWWMKSTLLWAGTLLVGTLFIGRENEILYSMPLQTALLVPSGAAAALLILRSPESPAGAACAQDR